MKGLSIAGTAAMFLVGGGILTHGLPWLHHAIESLTTSVGTVLGASGTLLASLLADGYRLETINRAALGNATGASSVQGMSLGMRHAF